MTRAATGRLERTRREHALAVFRDVLERTDDLAEAARQAGVSQRTARRWREALVRVPPAAAAIARGPRTRFIGRQLELEALHRMVRSGHSLVVVLGMGGIGKTRIALRYAELFEREVFAGGVYFAALGGAVSSDDVSQQVRAALGLELDSGQSIAAALARCGRALLVLDDVDRCARHAAPQVAAWAAAAPAATILMTARTRPGVVGEAVFELEAMPADPDGVTMFVDRARLVQSDFEPTPDSRRRIVDIVQRLDGIPLAIELAAARVGLFGLSELSVRLGARFDLLTTPGQSHPSLRAAIERSWQVLAEPERRVLAECSVFRGGFSLAAAERVATGDHVADAIQVLRDHSLLRSAGTGRNGEPRFDMYDSIRELASDELLDPGPAIARHAQFFLDAEVEPADLDNLRAVHERALANDPGTPENAAIALRALIAMHPLLARTGPLDEYQRALDATLARANAAGLDPAMRARAYAARGRVMRGLGKLDDCEADAKHALSLARSIGDRAIEAQARRDLGRLAQNLGRVDQALEHYQAALSLFADCGDLRSQAHLSSLQSDVANAQARDADALAHGQRAIELFTRLGDPDSRARALYVEGGLHFRAGRLGDARRAWDQAIELLEQLGDRRFEGYARCNLGILLCEVARYHSARIQLEAAYQRFARAGYQRLAAIVMGYLGTLEHRLSNLEAAQLRYLEAADSPRDSGSYFAGVFRSCRATALAQLGRREEAQLELARARELIGASGDPRAQLAHALHGHAVDILASPTPDGRARAAAALAAVPPSSLISDDVRLARELLSRCLGPTAATRRPEAWWIREDGTAFSAPGARLVDLSRRRPLARMLSALALLHADHPGAALPIGALFERAWPGERALESARTNRVNVALVTLRTLGLRLLLQRSAAGYLLDPRAAVELSAD
jgi:tetratricopeptide (TPR) repeat protein